MNTQHEHPQAPWPLRSLTRDGCEFSTLHGHLRIRSVDSLAGPVHLDHPALARLGLVLPTAGLAYASAARRWLERAPLDPRPAYGPAFTDPEWQMPEGLEVGDYLLSPNREGLDVFVWDHHEDEVLVLPGQLGALGLRRLEDPGAPPRDTE